MPASSEVQSRLKSIEALIHKIEQAKDPALAATAKELVQMLMEFHGAGIERLLEIVHQSPGAGESVIDALGRDESVRVMAVAINAFRTQQQAGAPDWTGLMACTILGAIPMVALLVFFGRKVVESFQFSGMK